MEETKIQNAPPAQLKPIIETGLLEETATETQEEKQVIMHCTFYVPLGFFTMRIWPTTYLKVRGLKHRSKILNAYSIYFYPKWGSVCAGSLTTFTLVFEGLPKDCTSFYLIEYTSDKGAFYTKPIQRNIFDVYWVDVFAKGNLCCKKS